MNIIGVHRCLVAATVSILLTLPFGAAAQQAEPPNEEQASDQSSAQSPQAQSVAAPRQLFVSDKLVLNVYAEAHQGSARVATIETGEAVDELERSGNLIRVRLDDGREGWVGANYLTSEAPAAVRVRELQREQKSAVQAAEKSAAEMARLKQESAALQAQVNALRSAASSAPSSAPKAPVDNNVTAAAAVEEEVPETPEDTEPQQPSAAVSLAAGPATWMWVLAVVLTGGLGYAAGYRSLDRKLRKKFGGLKLY